MEKIHTSTNGSRRRFLGAAAGAITAAQFGTVAANAQFLKLRQDPEFPSLAGATTWLNSKPLTPAGLRGRVVVVNIWTYSCINWLRSLPYVRAWEAKYRQQGLVVIGVHSPEFEFEKDVDKVRRAAAQMNISYPIAVDSDHAIWRAFSNESWPALYLIDAKGRIRHHRFGEGEYDKSERVIQQLLTEAGVTGVGNQLVSVDAQGAEVAADWRNLRSGENYLGYARTENFASPGHLVKDRRSIYATPARLRLNQWALSGDWTMGRQAITLNKASGRIVDRFRARDLHLVMGPSQQDQPIRFRIKIDGQQPGAAHGTDVNEQGDGVASEHRLYQLIRQQQPIVERHVEIEFLDTGVEAFSFTFG